MKSLRNLSIGLLSLFIAGQAFAHGNSEKDLYWIKIEAHDKYQRTEIAELGMPIEAVEEGYVVTLGTKEELKVAQEKFNVLVSFKEVQTLDYPQKDEKFHNYNELTTELQRLARENPEFVSLYSIGKSLEGRDIWGVTLTSNQKNHLDQPGIVYMGGHHAREHVSVEIPLMAIQKLIADYKARDERITRLLDTRSVYIIPIVNPDGAEYDIESGRYRSWRKNRRNNEGSTYVGVDLNRNYDFEWGTVGISHNPSSDVYCGPSAFSEPETQAIRDFVLGHENLTTVISFHTFSELILYPWGHTDQKIGKEIDYQVHSKMARKMAEWNGYVPQQGSDLYLVSGDTGDWAYGALGLVTFTFELDPRSIFQGGFYPGQDKIQPTFNKNWEPILYLMEYSDNPYRVVTDTHELYGLNSALIN